MTTCGHIIGIMIALMVIRLLPNNVDMYKMLFFATLVLLFYYGQMEYFEITPWKMTCQSNTPCPQCCLKGFRGFPVSFEYTSDADRMNCPQRGPGIGNRSNDYMYLNQYANQQEGFCNQKQRSLASAYGVTQQPGYPQEMGKNNPTIENFEGCPCGS